MTELKSICVVCKAENFCPFSRLDPVWKNCSGFKPKDGFRKVEGNLIKAEGEKE